MIYALCATVMNGLFWIAQKIESESKMNRDGFIFYLHLGMIIIPLLLWVSGYTTLIFDVYVLLLAMFINGVYVYVLKLRLKCLEYMTSSTYFINYRVFIAIFLLVLGQVIFQESISLNEYVGIAVGFVIFYLLIEKKNNTIDALANLKTGYVLLAISIILGGVIWLCHKYISYQDFSISTYVLYSGIIGAILPLIFRWNHTVKQTLICRWWRHISFVFFTAVIFSAGFYLNMVALIEGWDVWVVYKIISYGLIFPILFSIIYYKEPVTWKKLLAFILTIASIALFI